MEAIEDVRENEKDKERMLIERERNIQRQVVDVRIREARYNCKYKNVDLGISKPSYLRKKNMVNILIGQGVRALIRIRCENMEENNKYWLEKDCKICVFCRVG